jgi:uncharacterized protein (DUF1800 family)
MELHTLGVDGGYTQQDVSELSRVLTGWTFTGAGVFSFNPSRHDWGAKTVLGVTIPAGSPTLGQEGVKEGEQIIEFLLNHPNTARFIATKLLKWFVTPEPSEAQIAAIAGAYKATGGDIKRMVRATLNEGWIAQAPLKLKRPFHLVASGLRATDSVVANIDGMRVNRCVRSVSRSSSGKRPTGSPTSWSIGSATSCRAGRGRTRWQAATRPRPCA